MLYNISNPADLGWQSFYSSQLDVTELDTTIPVRVLEVHRNLLRVLGPALDRTIPPFYPPEGDEEAIPTVGDWLLLDAETYKPRRLLDRKSLFKRRAAGPGRKLQLLAANVDTVFIVTSCNHDFNIARLERYLALAHEAGVTPVIVLTKADLDDNPDAYAEKVRKLQADIFVETVNALDANSITCLTPWCGSGQTVALLGSSGVGKSTLVNTISGTQTSLTQGIREDDARGRHTTTGRVLHRLPQGGWLLDTPGMRELQLTDVAAGINDVFAEIQTLAQQCRFNNCKHETEPDCAVLLALESGELDARRLQHWRKLTAEEEFNSETLAERIRRNRAFGKMIKRIKKETNKG